MQDCPSSGIPLCGCFVDQRCQPRVVGNPMVWADHECFEVGGAATAQRIPEPLAQGPIRSTAIGHLHAQLKCLVANIEGRSCAIQTPAPTTAAMFAAVGVSANHDHSGAADQHDARLIGECASQGGAFVAGCQTASFRQQQFFSEKRSTPRLQGRPSLNAAGSNGRSIDRCCLVGIPTRSLRPVESGTVEAGADGSSKALFAISGIQMADSRS